MNPVAQLPPALSGWAVLRELFDDELAAALELLVRRLSAGIEFRHETELVTGEPNGYRGIARRGPMSRLLLSELAIADEIPEEFLRRISQGEAGYYDVALVEGTASGKLLVLFDTGPDQLGVARVGHVATILLLWRKAERAGITLEIGTLQCPGETIRGDLRDVVVWYLGRRTHRHARAEDVAVLAEVVSADDECWVCCGPSTASALRWPAGVEVVTFDEAGESDDGATHLRARHRTRHALVPMPARPDAIRLLRGRGFRRTGPPTSTATGTIRFPRFPGAAAQLLCRTDEPNVLVSFAVRGPNHPTSPRPKRRTFRGPVIAAGVIGARTVAVSFVDDQLVVEVIGKHLSKAAGISIPLDDVEIHASELDLVGAHPLRALAFRGDLNVELPSGWWQLTAQSRPIRQLIVAASPSDRPDVPYLVRAMNQQIWSSGFIAGAPVDAPFVLGAGHLGWGAHDTWTLTSLTANIRVDNRITTHLDRAPAGIVTIEGEPFFVGLSNAGHIVRLVGRTTHTVTRISGDVLDMAVHPLRPLIAVQHDDRSITVYDVASEAVVVRLAGSAT